MEKVTGLGGVFIKAKDPGALSAWYDTHLGIPFGGQSYVDFEWINKNNPDKPGHTIFSFFKEDTDYFSPSASPFMINFRVSNLDALLAKLKEEGVAVIGKTESFEYGKFGWIIDPEGNKIELWEPMNEK